MAEIQDILIPNGGMNLDDDSRFLRKTDTREVYNFRSGFSEDEKGGGMESPLGNTLISFSLPAGNNKVIGSCTDYENGYIYYFVYNPNNSHCILRYNESSGSVEKILYDEQLLNFHKYEKIHANIINGLLYWTSGYFDSYLYDSDNLLQFNPPRKINIEKAYNYTNSTSVSDTNKYDALTFQIMDVIKYPPQYSPTAAYGDDSNYNQNNLKNKLFQFRYRYVYDDYEKSVWSPISKVPLPEDEEYEGGIKVYDNTKNNKITVSINTGSREVIRIDLAVRIGNYDNWVIFRQLDKYDDDGSALLSSDISYDVDYYNNRLGIPLDQTDVARLQDYVPQIAECQEIVDNNNLDYSNYVEGYDNLDLDINLIPSLEQNYVTKLNINMVATTNGATIYIPSECYEGRIYYLYYHRPTADGEGEMVKVKYEMQSGDCATYPTSLANALDSYLSDNYNEGASISVCYGDKLCLSEPTAGIDTDLDYGFEIYSVNESLPSLKTGVWHDFGIMYFDRGKRSGSLQVDNSTSVRIPLPNEDNGGDEMIYQSKVIWQINHRPPNWATHYAWYKSKTTPYFIYMNVHNETGSDIQGLFRDGGNIYVDVNLEIADTHDLFDDFNKPTWTWQKGDRIRFIAYALNKNDPIRYFTSDNVNDQEIMDIDYPDGDDGYLYDSATTPNPIYDSDGNRIRNDERMRFVLQEFDISDIKNNEVIIVEVYRPQKELDVEDKVYYEIGEQYEILNPHTSDRQHQSQSGYADQNYDTSVPAQGMFNCNDVYLRTRTTANATFPCEDIEYSDFYDSDVHNYGRTGVVLKDMQRRKYFANTRVSDKFFQNTFDNGLSTFRSDKYLALNEEDGEIKSTVMIGYTLKVYQQHKVTSIYIGRTALVNSVGKEYLEKSTEVLGTVVPHNIQAGCNNPESVIVVDRYVYFVDIYRGKVYRDAANGLFPISEYKMRDWIKDKCQSLRENHSNVEILAGYNRKYDEIYFSFKGFNDSTLLDTCDTVTFNESGNRWKHFLKLEKTISGIKYYPDYYADFGNLFVSFLKGSLYVHNNNTSYNEFYGEQKQIEVNLVTNENPLAVKAFLALVLNASEPLDVEMTVDADEELPHGMYTELKKETFDYIEGVYYSQVPRDMYTSTDHSTAPVARMNDYFNGRNMRGATMNIKLTLSTSDFVTLSSVLTKSILSEKSGT